jgi:hypothetical protein
MKKESNSFIYPITSKYIDSGLMSPWQVFLDFRYIKQERTEIKIWIN